MKVMLDSDACIHIMKHDPRMQPKAALDECSISQIVLGELEYGVFNSPPNRQQENRQSLYDFLGAVVVRPITNDHLLVGLNADQYASEMRAAMAG